MTPFDDDALDERDTRRLSDINVTPMLDVLLVLLVAFMAGLDTLRHTSDVQLPEPCAAPCVGHTAAIVLEVLPGDEYRLNSRRLSGRELPAALRDAYDGRPEKVLHVAARPGVTYQHVIAAIDTARGAGVRVISLLAETARREK